MLACNPAATPIEVGKDLCKNSGLVADFVWEGVVDAPYRSAMGSLLYLCSWTRPDLAAVVNSLCRYSQNPATQHWEGVKRVLRYIRGTLTHGLLYQSGEELPVWGYSDSSHGNDEATRKGKGGYVFISGGAAIN